MSSFFDDTENFGLMLFIAGIVGIIASVVAIAYICSLGGGYFAAYLSGYVTGFVILCVGTLITSLVILLFGLNVRGSGNKISFLAGLSDFIGTPSNDKPGLLTGLTRVVGITSIIGGVFGIASGAMLYGGFVGNGIFAILVGIFLYWLAPQILGESKLFDKNILWIILIIVYVLEALYSLGGIFLAGFSLWFTLLAIQSLCMLFVYIFGLLYTVSPEVKELMNV